MQLNLMEKYFRLISDDVQMAYETRYRPYISPQIIAPGVTRRISSLIGFPCNRVLVRIILPVPLPGTGTGTGACQGL